MVELRADTAGEERPRVAVIHLGARLHYEVPAVLAESGLLCALYTDFALFEGETGIWSRVLARFLPRGGRRLLARRLPACIPKDRVRRFPWLTLRNAAYEKGLPARRKSPTFVAAHSLGGHQLSTALIARNFENASALYVHPCVSTAAVFEAKQRGLFVVYESTAHPLDQFIEAAEYEARGLVAPIDRADRIDNYELFLREARTADLVLAASSYAASGLVEAGVSREQIEIVPYGIDPAPSQRAARPVPGRVLFVGTVGFRKGLPYLGEAARLLRANGVPVEVRVVGPFEDGLARREELAGPYYRGQVPRSEINEEFEAADLFVFPTLSDGFGIVLVEALRAGLPIIATPNCADVVEHGVNGLVVPARNGAAIAEAIMTIVSDRALRDRMSQESRRIFRRFTREAYGGRLTEVIASRFRTRGTRTAANGAV